MRQMTVVAVALALPIVSLAPLYCGGDDPAAMACCREQANACNQPGASDDDCCRDAPADGQAARAAGAVKVEALADAALATLAVVVGRPMTPAPQGTPGAVGIRWLGLAQDRPPPPLSVLRI